MWEIAATGYDNSGVIPVLRVFAPSGEELTGDGELSGKLILNLPESGVYRVLVTPSEDGAQAGFYLLTVATAG